jgi:nucleotide-binding universal stress UspA family protein
MFREMERKDLYTLLCIHSPPVSDEWVAYTNYLGSLLECRPAHRSLLVPSDDRKSFASIVGPIEENPQPPMWLIDDKPVATWDERPVTSPADFDLVVVNDSQPLWWQRLLKQIPAKQILEKSTGSVMFARNPRRPLRHILLVVRAHESDAIALTWIERLAVPGGAQVTLMPIVPPYPRMHQHDNKIQQGLEALMAPNSSSGAALQRYIRQLDRLDIQGTVCWKQGPPEDQIRREVRDTDHDLIVIAGEPFGRLSRWFLGELVGLLLGIADRPVLVAR